MAEFIGLKYWTFYGTDTPRANPIKLFTAVIYEFL